MSQTLVETLKSTDWFHADGFPIAVEPRNPQLPFALHDHEFCEIVVITGGHELHLTGTESWPMVVGDVFVITGRRPHTYDNMDDLSLVNILYQPEWLRLDMRDLLEMPGYHVLFHLEPAWRASHQFNSRLHLAPAELRKVTVLIDRLEQELAVRQAGFQFVATALFMEIVGFLSRCYPRNVQGNSQCLLRIGQAIAYLEVHFQEPMDLEYLAQIGNMSKRSLMRAFKKAMRISPISYLIQVRMAKAVELLRQEELTIAEIAHRVGYADSNYFSRLFNTTMGLAPTTYRRRLLAEQTVLSEQRGSGQRGSGHLHNHAAISWQTQ